MPPLPHAFVSPPGRDSSSARPSCASSTTHRPKSMTTLTPRKPYSPEELEQLYPKGLKLQLVQVVSFKKLFQLFPSSPS